MRRPLSWRRFPGREAHGRDRTGSQAHDAVRHAAQKTRLSPPRPCVPITMRSQRSSVASFRISSTTTPERMTVCADTPAPRISAARAARVFSAQARCASYTLRGSTSPFAVGKIRRDQDLLHRSSVPFGGTGLPDTHTVRPSRLSKGNAGNPTGAPTPHRGIRGPPGRGRLRRGQRSSTRARWARTEASPASRVTRGAARASARAT